MRHDPDVILVGETRNAETAKTALNAALTGHLVFSTLHTNNTVESISRLLMMGVEAYLLAPALQMIIAQRLVRKVCPHCVTKRQANDQEHAFLTKQIEKIQEIRPDLVLSYDGMIPTVGGCDHCNGTGYNGRLAVLEVLEMTSEIRELIVQDLKNTAQIMQVLRSNGFLTLQEDALIKMLSGQTTIEELRRII